MKTPKELREYFADTGCSCLQDNSSAEGPVYYELIRRTTAGWLGLPPGTAGEVRAWTANGSLHAMPGDLEWSSYGQEDEQ